MRSRSFAGVNSNEELLAAEEQLRQMQVSQALELFHRAEKSNCNADACSAGRWTCHMLTGNFARAWDESDRITARGNPDPHRYWDGKPVEGRNVLVRCLHGLGDTLQFIRYAPLIRERACSLTIEAQPSLKTLLDASNLADRVMTWGEPEPAWDQQIETNELPRVFRTEVSTIPRHVPYLKAAPERAPLAANPGHFSVGIVWRSSNFNPLRSIPAALIASLFDIPGVSFFSLQAGPEKLELAPWSSRITDLDRDECSVLTTAGLVQTLDLIITVDTMMAHLAGALARPVWTLLPYACDWRWMMNRDDSPWYPTMRLFRQAKAGDWLSVVEQIKAELPLVACAAQRHLFTPWVQGV